MALEDLLKGLISSLDANTAALKGAAPASDAKAATTKAPAKDKTPEVSFDAVKEAAARVKEKHGTPVTKKIIETAGGAKELASVKKEKYAALVAAFEAALTDEPEAEGDDDL